MYARSTVNSALARGGDLSRVDPTHILEMQSALAAIDAAKEPVLYGDREEWEAK